MSVSSTEIRESRRSVNDVRTKYVAEAGYEAGMLFLQNAVKLNSSYDPLAGLEALLPVDGATLSPIVGQPLLDNGAQVGAYSVTMTRMGSSSTNMTVKLDATGYLPDAPNNLLPGQHMQNWSAISVTMDFGLKPASVFDYSYFINNWGWFYGNTIFANGNARSNGQFDVANYSPTITGQPIYDGVDDSGATVALSGYHDDNGDGLDDGNDGGVWSGWDIIRASNLQGNGGNASNQHDFADSVEMPNLSNLTQYQDQAIAQSGSISIAGSSMVAGVYGDDPGETGHLYLHGTLADPIELNGPVVATGDVIISGYVTGQGSIYAGGNVYMPDSVTYVNPPDSERPASGQQAATEAWLTTNQNADFMGLYSAENVVVGDYTDSTWRYYVGGWMGSSLNQSSEDSGEDNIPNTTAGVDGIDGTADDDVLEGDGVFTVDQYTQADYDLGLIPPGLGIGDVVPGSGEDIDGDGIYDGTTTLSDVDMAVPMEASNWGGNMPPGGISKYEDIASNHAYNLDAVIYTNHSFCYFVYGSEPAQINGSLVSRNENIVYGTPFIEINHDSRLLGGNGSLVQNLLPKTMKTPELIRWQDLDADPNRYIGVAP